MHEVRMMCPECYRAHDRAGIFCPVCSAHWRDQADLVRKMVAATPKLESANADICHT